MAQEWQELTKITRGAAITVERVRIKHNEVAVEGSFELPSIAKLTNEDQKFLTAFVKSHGSIKDMEKLFKISYPTVKKRLDEIAKMLEIEEIVPGEKKSQAKKKKKR